MKRTIAPRWLSCGSHGVRRDCCHWYRLAWRRRQGSAMGQQQPLCTQRNSWVGRGTNARSSLHPPAALDVERGRGRTRLARSSLQNKSPAMCEAAHTSSGMGKFIRGAAPDTCWGASVLWRAPCRASSFGAGACRGSSSTSDSREACLRFERIERLLVPGVAVRQPRLRRLLGLLSVGEYGGGRQRSRDRRPRSDQRPCRIEDCLDSGCTI
jgi:hypothetical protein